MHPNKENLVELISWRKGDIASAAFAVGQLLVRNVNPDQNYVWHAFRDNQLLPTIKTERPIPISFRPEGYELIFSWPELKMEQGKYSDMWYVEEPTIKVVDHSWGELAPSGRNRLFQTSNALVRGMEESYGLTVTKGSARTTFSFTKEYYAIPTVPVRAIILESPN